MQSNEYALLSEDLGVCGELFSQDSVHVVLRKPRHRQLLVRLQCEVEKQLFLLLQKRIIYF